MCQGIRIYSTLAAHLTGLADNTVSSAPSRSAPDLRGSALVSRLASSFVGSTRVTVGAAPRLVSSVSAADLALGAELVERQTLVAKHRAWGTAEGEGGSSWAFLTTAHLGRIALCRTEVPFAALLGTIIDHARRVKCSVSAADSSGGALDLPGGFVTVAGGVGRRACRLRRRGRACRRSRSSGCSRSAGLSVLVDLTVAAEIVV